MDLSNLKCAKEIDFDQIGDTANTSAYFDEHLDSPLRRKKVDDKMDLDKTDNSAKVNSNDLLLDNEKPPHPSNVFEKLYSGRESVSVKFGNSSDKIVQQGVRFVSSKPTTVPKSPMLRTKYRTRGYRNEKLSDPDLENKVQKNEPKGFKRQTIPESPLLHTKERVRRRNDPDDLNLRKLKSNLETIDLHKHKQSTLKDSSIRSHKMPLYSGIRIEKSKVPLTEPKSPILSYKLKRNNFEMDEK